MGGEDGSCEIGTDFTKPMALTHRADIEPQSGYAISEPVWTSRRGRNGADGCDIGLKRNSPSCRERFQLGIGKTHRFCRLILLIDGHGTPTFDPVCPGAGPVTRRAIARYRKIRIGSDAGPQN